jgi:hypothetical protein
VVARQSRCSLVSYCESRLATPYLIRHLHNLVGVCCTSDVLLLLDYSTTGSQPSTGFFGLVIFWLGKGNFGIPTRYLLGSHAVGRLQACLRLPCALRSRWLPPAARELCLLCTIFRHPSPIIPLSIPPSHHPVLILLSQVASTWVLSSRCPPSIYLGLLPQPQPSATTQAIVVRPARRGPCNQRATGTGRRVLNFDRACACAESTESAEARLFMRKSLPLPAVHRHSWGNCNQTRPPQRNTPPITGILRGHHLHPKHTEESV